MPLALFLKWASQSALKRTWTIHGQISPKLWEICHLDVQKGGGGSQFFWTIFKNPVKPLRCIPQWVNESVIAKNAERVGLNTFCKTFYTNEVFKRLQIWQNILYHTVILHSKLSLITPKRPEIAPDHTKSSKSMHLGYIFWLGRQTMFLHCPPPQTEGTHPYFKWPFGRCFLFQSEKKHISGHN